ncbi:MAG: hypothetical protein IKT09_04140 [Synergistes sp.]|nr:hypothetical protein [Synergistes sp.]
MSYEVKGIITNYKQRAGNKVTIQINGDIYIDDKFNLWIEEKKEPKECILMPKDTEITVANNFSTLCAVVTLNKSKCTFTIDTTTGNVLQSIEINN